MLALGVTFYQISVTVMPKLLRVTKKEYWDSSTYAMQYMSDFVAAHGGKLVMGCVGLILFAIVSMPRLTGRVRFYLDKIPPGPCTESFKARSFSTTSAFFLRRAYRRLRFLTICRSAHLRT